MLSCKIVSMVDSETLADLQKVNSVVLPVPLPNCVYRDALKFCTKNYHSLIAYVNDDAVGAICCRDEIADFSLSSSYPLSASDLESQSDNKLTSSILHLLSIAVLAPYRREKIGSLLLAQMLASSGMSDIQEVQLHVSTSDMESQSFYQHCGFRFVGFAKEYYRRPKKLDAHILSLCRPFEPVVDGLLKLCHRNISSSFFPHSAFFISAANSISVSFNSSSSSSSSSSVSFNSSSSSSLSSFSSSSSSTSSSSSCSSSSSVACSPSSYSASASSTTTSFCSEEELCRKNANLEQNQPKNENHLKRKTQMNLHSYWKKSALSQNNL